MRVGGHEFVEQSQIKSASSWVFGTANLLAESRCFVGRDMLGDDDQQGDGNDGDSVICPEHSDVTDDSGARTGQTTTMAAVPSKQFPLVKYTPLHGPLCALYSHRPESLAPLVASPLSTARPAVRPPRLRLLRSGEPSNGARFDPPNQIRLGAISLSSRLPLSASLFDLSQVVGTSHIISDG